MEAFENLDALDNQNQIEKLSDFSALKIDNAVSDTPIKNEPVKPIKPTNKKEEPKPQEGFGTTLGGVIGTTGGVSNTPIKNEPVKPIKPTNKKKEPKLQQGF